MSIKKHMIANCQVIIIDNSPRRSTRVKLNELNMDIQYYPMDKNIGFAAAHNFAVSKSKSLNHLILNPDCQVTEDLFKLIKHFDDPNCMCVVPSIKNTYEVEELSTSRLPKYLEWFLIYSWISNLRFCKNFREKFWYRNIDFGKHQVEFASGACMLFRTKDLLLELFDNRFFLYFEDMDLCTRIKNKGKYIVKDSSISVVHQKEGSLIPSSKRNAIFNESRYQYLIKWYGLRKALLLNNFLVFFELVALWRKKYPWL